MQKQKAVIFDIDETVCMFLIADKIMKFINF